MVVSSLVKRAHGLRVARELAVGSLREGFEEFDLAERGCDDNTLPSGLTELIIVHTGTVFDSVDAGCQQIVDCCVRKRVNGQARARFVRGGNCVTQDLTWPQGAQIRF